MKTESNSRLSPSIFLSIAVAFVASACATATPVELNNARIAYNRASVGPAAQVSPSDLHVAKTALDRAEASFAEGEDMQKIVDLAYVAERTAQIAEAHAQTALATASVAKSKQEYGDKQAEISKKTLGNLAATRAQLGEAERGKAQQTQQAGAERAAREDADRKAAASEQKVAVAEQQTAAAEQQAAVAAQQAKDANDALAKLAAKEEERGLVITLSGSVLFRSNDSTLLPAAQSRLDQVAEALVAKGQTVVVEGYTDSKGSQATNQSLSQRRAESVRGYLVSRGFPGEKISARGMGPDRPVADNTSAEGRANNRRVEIVIAKGASRIN